MKPRMRWLIFRRRYMRWLPWCVRRGCWKHRHLSFDVCPQHARASVEALRVLFSECDDDLEASTDADEDNQKPAPYRCACGAAAYIVGGFCGSCGTRSAPKRRDF